MELPVSALDKDTDYQWFDVVRPTRDPSATGWVRVVPSEMPGIKSDSESVIQDGHLRLFKRPMGNLEQDARAGASDCRTGAGETSGGGARSMPSHVTSRTYAVVEIAASTVVLCDGVAPRQLVWFDVITQNRFAVHAHE